ncbi:MAG: hypothetical protein WC966_11835 [Bradymonadales bacterium]|jgi:serine/threonine protein kinase
MNLRELKAGTLIDNEITLRSLLESHRGITRYLGTYRGNLHVLVHVLPNNTVEGLAALNQAVRVGNELQAANARCGVYEEFLYFSEIFPLGEYLFEWLERRERVTTTEALRRIISLLKVLVQAHELGVYHGRISPKTVLIERSGAAFGLRLMGLGVAQAMELGRRFDIDWYEYSFDLEGLAPHAVDIFGLAIVLMGMVSGESGIDSFEATGILPQALRGRVIKRSMERALALGEDTYESAFEFMQDLEAALLELDESQGELYVGDLVGFQSVIRNVVGKDAQVERNSDYSGLWNAIVNDLDKEERSSILYSLTSLNALKVSDSDDEDEDDDDDETKITAAPSGMFGVRRIQSTRSEEVSGVTQIMERPKVEAIKHTDSQQEARVKTTEERIAELKALEPPRDEEEDSPTRVMRRPNYQSMSISSQDSDGVISAVNAAILEANKEHAFMKRIYDEKIEVCTLQILPCFYYAPDDPIAFPPQDEEEKPIDEVALATRQSLKLLAAPKPRQAEIAMQQEDTEQLHRSNTWETFNNKRNKSSKKPFYIISALLILIIFALLIIILLAR